MFLYYHPVSEFDRLFEDAFAALFSPCALPAQARHSASQHRDVCYPRSDLFESNHDSNTVTAMFEHPGLTSDGVTIDVHQNHLTVSGEPAAPDSEEKNYCVESIALGNLPGHCSVLLGPSPKMEGHDRE